MFIQLIPQLMRSSAILLALIVLPSVSVSIAAQESLDERLQREFNETVRPLLKTHCGDCHMGGANEAGVNLEDYVSIDKFESMRALGNKYEVS